VKANISELLEETFLNFRPLAEQRNLEYNLRIPSIPLYAYVDTEALNKILCNLFSNAVKYAATNVEVRLLPFSIASKSFTIEVRNDGFLIPIEKKEKIFQPFFRLKETEKQKGTGIGLALARSLVELHKGILELQLPEQDFNVFRLTLPIHQEKEFVFDEEKTDQPLITEINKD
jgi:signal transduction histidine kinase